jgi:hypothetical protein
MDIVNPRREGRIGIGNKVFPILIRRAFTMPMRGALANAGEGVVGRARRLRGSYGAPGREGDKDSVSRRQAMGSRPSKRAGRCRAGHRPVSTCRRRDRLIAPRGRRDGSGFAPGSTAGVRQVVATIDVARAKPATGILSVTRRRGRRRWLRTWAKCGQQIEPAGRYGRPTVCGRRGRVRRQANSEIAPSFC